MNKEIVKIMIIIISIICYLMNLIFMFFSRPFDLLISNIIIWLMCLVIMIGFKFVDWLNDW